MVKQIYEALYPDKRDFSTDDILDLLERRPEIGRMNVGIERNEGLQRSLARDREASGNAPS
jgi:spore coat polysaccharide biosynthesis protein SpsF